MPLTKFPKGISSFGVPVLGGGGMGIVPFSTGTYFFVDSNTGSDGNSGTDPSAPLATIKQAVALCTANKGDVIIVFPNHAETLSGANAIDFNIAGVTCVGIGNGTNRPTITVGGTTATTIKVSAANVTVRNIRMTAGVDELVLIWDIQAAYCTLDTVDFFETTAKQAIRFAQFASTGTDCTMMNCTHRQKTAAAANSIWISLNASDRFRMVGCLIDLTTTNSASSSVLAGVTALSNDIALESNVFKQEGGASVIAVNLFAATTGYAHDNRIASTKTAIAGSFAIQNLYCSENYASHNVNKNGFLEPVVDT